MLVFTTNAFAEPLVKSGSRVWVIGDSLAWLLMHELPVLAQKENVILKGNPVPGSSVISWSQRHNREIAVMNAFKPDVLVVCLGANDAYMGPDVIKNEPPFLAALLRRLQSKDRTIVWVLPPKLERAKRGLENFANMIESSVSYRVLDSHQIRIEMWNDKLHPSASGRAIWAQWIWNYLSPKLYIAT